jgi:uncharacterized membrane protein
MTTGDRRRSGSDRLFAAPLGPREREALEIVRRRPGITIGELREELGVGRARIWQIVGRLERGFVSRDPLR